MRRLIRAPLRTAVGTLVRTRPGLHLVNALHRRLSPHARRRFFYLCCNQAWRVQGPWTVDFAGRRLKLLLSREFADAWELAISFHGYDAELHAFYEALVRGPRPPRAVFDVGANCGLHALRFLVHGARVIAFEPNPECHPWFRMWCDANDVPCELEPVAVGDRAASVELAFPEGRTYLGSTISDVRADWRGPVRTVSVRQVALDDVVATRGVVPDLIKIDTEGAEAAVLRGAVDLLRTVQPMLIFEAWPSAAVRRVLWGLLDKHGYAIAAIDGGTPHALTHADFCGARATNFVAEVLPGRVIHSARQ